MTIEFQDMSGLVGQLAYVLYKTKRIQQLSETYGMWVTVFINMSSFP